MGLLDDVPMPKRLPTTGKWRRSQHEFEPDVNFADLQNLGHKENSKDFEDSMFADRQHQEGEKQV